LDIESTSGNKPILKNKLARTQFMRLNLCRELTLQIERVFGVKQ